MMAGLDVVLSATQVAGNHAAIYESYYKQVDQAGIGRVDATIAAQFLKRSALPDAVLVKIWDLSDSSGQGYLDRYGFFVALKLISLAQNGHDVRLVNLIQGTPAPNMGESETASLDWAIKPTEQLKYDQLFASLGPVNGKLSSAVVRPVMMNSKLPVEVLVRVWDLSDLDKDGSLDREEFSLAMHLIYKALENYPVPLALPPDLLPSVKRKKTFAGSVPVLPPYPGGGVGPLVEAPMVALTAFGTNSMPSDSDTVVGWVVTSSDRVRYDAMFKVADLDVDGYVNGVEIKDVFLQSGLPQTDLARIWSLCDMKQEGRLDSDQFALAMHLVHQRLLGAELPSVLASEMVPPSMRPRGGMEDPATGGAFSNPEMESIGKDIEELNREKHQLEQDIAQKEADVCIKNGEIKSLQSELTTLSATLKQLETQKGEARKRLDDLENQKSSLDDTVREMRIQLEDERHQVRNLKSRLEEQEKSVKEQETELSAKRKELGDLRVEESKLEQVIVSSERQLEHLGKTLADTVAHIEAARSKVPGLRAHKRQLDEAIEAFDSAIHAKDASAVPETLIRPIPPLPDAEVPTTQVPRATVDSFEDFTEDPFASKDPFGNTNGFSADPFGGQDPFQEDPFKVSAVADGASADPFHEAFTRGDPFQDADPFGGFASQPAPAKRNAFDPFGSENAQKTNDTMELGGDPFGGEPFGSCPARPESPTPALPPKKSKQPPPRPAPPKGPGSKVGPPRPLPDPFASASRRGPPSKPDPFAPVGAASDPFGGSAAHFGDDGFADFSNFETKLDFSAMSEEEQLTWAKRESERAETERMMLAKREQDDLNLALAISLSMDRGNDDGT